MSKLPVQDPTIRIIPSPELFKFIFTKLKNEKSMPENILKIFKTRNKKLNPKKFEDEIENIKFTEEEEKLIKSINISDENKASLSDFEIVKSAELESEYALTLNDMKWLSNTLMKLRKDGKTDLYLHELIKGSDLVLPQNEIQERNPELEARCVRLRKEQEDREYRAMTKNVDNVRKHEPEETIASQIKQINRQLIAVLQFVFSVAAGFAFGFIGVELIVGQLDFGFRLLLGIIVSLIIALAEIYFLAKKLNEEYDVLEVKKNIAMPKTSKKLHED